jgi:endogenous inhibitor of DNA gyrase (YacG/DUF329 family)
MSRDVKCPRCGQLTQFSPENPFRPFCSERCQTLDLGAWAEEKYKVPVNENSEEENAASLDISQKH